LGTADKRGSVETLRASIGCGTPILTGQIDSPSQRVIPRVLPEAGIDRSEHEAHLSDDDDEEPEPTNHGDNDDDRGDTIAYEVTMADTPVMLEQKRKLVAILLENTVMRPPSSRSESKHGFKIAHPRHYGGGPCELETFLGTVR